MFVIYANQSTVNTKLNLDHSGLNVLLMVGVNGSGKTTTIKLILGLQSIDKRQCKNKWI